MPNRWTLGIGLALALICAASATWAGELASIHELDIELGADGDVMVAETISLFGDWKGTNLTRSFWLRQAEDAWPLRQDVVDVSVEDRDGNGIAFRKRRYEDRANIDLLEVPDSGVVVVRYRVHRPLQLKTERASWQWMVTGYVWKATVERVRVRLVAPHPLVPEKSVLRYELGYSQGEDVRQVAAVASGGGVVWEFAPNAQPDEPIGIALTFDRGDVGPVPAEWFWQDMVALVRISLVALGALGMLAIVLLFVRPGHAVNATGLANFIPAVVALYSAFGVTAYWYFEQGHRGAGDDFSGELIVNFGLAGFVALFAWKQRRVLALGRRAAYFAQLAFPTVLVVAWPIAFVDRAMLLFPVLALPVYLYWPRRKIALEFGVGAHRIAEEVGGRGEVTVAELAAAMKMAPESILKALRQNPHLPVVVDNVRGVVLSAEAAALHEELKVCTYCGGATEAAGMAVRQCGYCGREFTSNKERRTQKPLPVVIESLAIFFDTLALGGYFFAGTIGVAILVMDTVGGNFVSGAIGGVISAILFSVPPFLCGSLASRLREGKGIAITTALLLLFFWLLGPLLVLRSLHSKRVRIFTGRFDLDELGKLLAQRGEMDISEFARYLRCSREDAAELAQYLAVNQLIDAVYDRRGSRLVSRQLYRDIAKEGSCKQCGGYFGVHGGRATCHFCGASQDHVGQGA